MTNWTRLINKDAVVVTNFAQGTVSAKDFESAFSGSSNPARSVVRKYGVSHARNLARKSLRRRGILN